MHDFPGSGRLFVERKPSAQHGAHGARQGANAGGRPAADVEDFASEVRWPIAGQHQCAHDVVDMNKVPALLAVAIEIESFFAQSGVAKCGNNGRKCARSALPRSVNVKQAQHHGVDAAIRCIALAVEFGGTFADGVIGKGPGRRCFFESMPFGIAVDCAARREDDPRFGWGLGGRFENGHRSLHVGSGVLGRLGKAELHRAIGRQVHDGIAVLGRSSELCLVANIRFEKLRTCRDGIAFARGEVVQDANAVTARGQAPPDNATDKARAPCDQHSLHTRSIARSASG